MPKKIRAKLAKTPDFDVLSLNPKTTATIIKERLQYDGIKNVSILQHKGLGELIAPHYEIKVHKETVAFIYKPLACHSYNIIKSKHASVKNCYNRYYVEFLFSIFIYKSPLL